MACGYSHDIEEVREGEDQTYHKPTNRKRSARNAKCTKPAADGEGCGCEGGKKGKKTCGCDTCSPKMDSLTAGMFRADLKCGRGSISEGEKCSKGPAQRVASKGSGGSRVRKGLENAAIVAGTAGTVFSYGQVAGHALSGNLAGASRALQREGAFAALSGAGMYAKGARTKNKRLKAEGATTVGAGAVAVGAGHLLGGGYTKGMKPPSIAGARTGLRNAMGRASAAKSNLTRRKYKSQLERMYRGPGRRDSVYAPGFTPDMENLSI